jgi:hypothetical protein
MVFVGVHGGNEVVDGLECVFDFFLCGGFGFVCSSVLTFDRFVVGKLGCCQCCCYSIGATLIHPLL